jgi:hypothetical protein
MILDKASDMGEGYSLGRIFFLFFFPTTAEDIGDALHIFSPLLQLLFSFSRPSNWLVFIHKKNKTEKKKGKAKQGHAVILLKKSDRVFERILIRNSVMLIQRKKGEF